MAPVLLDAIEFDGESGEIEIPVRNVGRGAARITGVTWGMVNGAERFLLLRWPVIVPAGEAATVEHVIPTSDPFLETMRAREAEERFWFGVPYTSLGGTRVGTLEATLAPDYCDAWVVDELRPRMLPTQRDS